MALISSKLPHVGTTIFTVMSQLANHHQAINLSQGFPDFDCSPKLTGLVSTYMGEGFNQYAPMPGYIGLRERIAEKVSDIHQVDFHPDTEVTVTAGATQALFTAIAATIQPGDEAIIFEPAYDSYRPSVLAFGGVVKAVSLSAPDFIIDWAGVKKLITPKTKLIIVNTPNNPSGRILHEADYRELVSLTKNTNIILICDEVYEHIIFDGLAHKSAIHYPELRERSFVVASYGKLYHTTGWKVGYVLAPAELMSEFRKIHQFNVFSVNTPTQYALAAFMEDKDEYLGLRAFFQEKHDLVYGALLGSAFKPVKSQGTYFLLADYSAVSDLPEIDFAKKLTAVHGVATIPVSAFYEDVRDQQIVRICFAKKAETLARALEKLTGIKQL